MFRRMSSAKKHPSPTRSAPVTSPPPSGLDLKGGGAARQRLGSIAEPAVVGDDGADGVLGCFKAKYFGSVSVDKPDGFDVVLSATLKVKNQGQDARKVWLTISRADLKLTDRHSGDVVQNTDIQDVTYSGLDPKDKKQFVYITRTKLGLWYCHVFAVKEKAAEIPKTINKAFQSPASPAAQHHAPVARRTSLQSIPSAGGSGTPLARQISVPASLSPQMGGLASPGSPGLSPAAAAAAIRTAASAGGGGPTLRRTFDAFFLGSQPVSEQMGNQIIKDAVIKNEEHRKALNAVRKGKGSKKGPDTGEQVTLIVTSESVRTVERLTGETVMAEFIRNISFTGVPEIQELRSKKDKRDQDYFAYIANNERLGRISCNIFATPAGQGPEICAAISEAFRICKEEERNRGENPFAVTDPRREPVQGELFKRQIHRRDIVASKILGAGQYGQVYLANQTVRMGVGENGGDTVRRAVKILRNGATPADKKEFFREAETMLELKHPNLVSMIGVALQQKPWLHVLEFLQYGDLRAVLEACQEKRIKLTLAEQLYWGVQLCSGCEYMAQRRLVHMDLAARNCMLGSNNIVKVGDFGLTRPYDRGRDYYYLKEKLRLPLKWVAIEGLDDKIFSEASDVWAFGVMMWEIFTYGAQPYADIRTADIQRRVREGLRLPRPQCPHKVYAIIAKCWHPDRKARWTFAALKREFHTIISSLPASRRRDLGKTLQEEDNPYRLLEEVQNRAPASPNSFRKSIKLRTQVESDAQGHRIMRVGSVSRRNPLFAAQNGGDDDQPEMPPRRGVGRGRGSVAQRGGGGGGVGRGRGSVAQRGGAAPRGGSVVRPAGAASPHMNRSMRGAGATSPHMNRSMMRPPPAVKPYQGPPVGVAQPSPQRPGPPPVKPYAGPAPAVAAAASLPAASSPRLLNCPYCKISFEGMDQLGITFHLQFHEEAPTEPAPSPPEEEEEEEENEEEAALPVLSDEELDSYQACPLCKLSLMGKDRNTKRVHVEFCRDAKDMGLLEPMAPLPKISRHNKPTNDFALLQDALALSSDEEDSPDGEALSGFSELEIVPGNTAAAPATHRNSRVATSTDTEKPAQILDRIGMGQYKPVFQQNSISSFIFAQMDDNMLLAIGVSNPLHREAILRAAQDYKSRSKDQVLEKAQKLRTQAARVTASAEAAAQVLKHDREQKRRSLIAKEPIYAERRQKDKEIGDKLKDRASKLEVSNETEKELQVHEAKSKLFVTEQPKRSKIWMALNPQPLAYQTAADRAERETAVDVGKIVPKNYEDVALLLQKKGERKEKREARAAGGYGFDPPPEIEDDESEYEEESDFDEDDLPDFGAMSEEFMKMRARREEEEEARREALRQQHLEAKKLENIAREKELAVIRAQMEAEAQEKLRKQDAIVEEAQKRLETELTFTFKWGG